MRSESRRPAQRQLAHVLILWATLCCSSLVSVEVLARCALAPVELKQLSAKLEGSSSRVAWAEVWGELITLEQKLTAAKTGIAERAVALQCLYGLQFDASFYLSASRVEARLWSARALGAKLSLEELEAQRERAPSRMELAQRRLRAQELQRALSSRPKGVTWSPWMSARGSVMVKIPALTRAVTLSIQHPQPAAWLVQCGLSAGCEERPSWTLRLPAGRETTLSLPKAEYHLRWSGPCADEEGGLLLNKEKAKQVTLPPPALACRSAVTLSDPHSGENWSAGLVEEGETKQLSRPGYYDVSVTGREGGEPITVELKRCERPITWVVTPSSARVAAPESIPWGVPTNVSVSSPGYAALKRTIELPKPSSCEPTSHHLDLALSREVNVRLISEAGRPIKAQVLRLSGLEEPLSGQTKRPPGLYQGYARSEGFQPLIFRLEVPPCSLDHYEPSRLSKGSQPRLEQGRCQPFEQQLKLSALAPEPATTDQQLKRTGLVLAATGLTLLATHALGLVEYQGASYTGSLKRRREALARGQLWSYGMLGAGALSYGLGALWPALSIESSTEERTP